MTSAPAGGALVPTETMRSLSTTITAFEIVLPDPSTTFAARMAFGAARAGIGAVASRPHSTHRTPRRHEGAAITRTSLSLLPVDLRSRGPAIGERARGRAGRS